MIANINKMVIVGAGTAGLVTALIMREKFAHINITIVKSSKIGIIGVGEGSTEHWNGFMNLVNISVNELIKETKATVKIGILFKDWLRKGHEYCHNVGGGAEFSGLNRMDIYNFLALNNRDSPFPVSPGFHIFREHKVIVHNNLLVGNQYHFDTFALNEFLTKKCMERQITFLENDVESVDLDHFGNVSSLKFEDKSTLSGDFFVDCSGMNRIISKELDNKWISYERYLPMNRAIAFPTEFKKNQNYEPYTTATALSAGWAWKIPTQERYGNGYVFNTNYITADEALNELSKSLKKKVEKVGKDIPFTAGRLEKFWSKNCISIGLAGSFAEPLEAQSIGFTILQANGLSDMLDGWLVNNQIVENLYNATFSESFDNIISYIQAHYFVNRDDTEFWKDRPFELTPFNQATISQFQQGHFHWSYFPNRYLMFYAVNFYQIYLGLNLINLQSLENLFEKNRENYNKVVADRANAAMQLQYLMVLDHKDYINLMCNVK